MDEVLDDLLRHWLRDEPVGLATIVGVSGSAPHPAGTSMLVAADGSVTGSVSAGCVEADLHDRCLEAVRTGRSGLAGYGVADDDAFDVGLTCGGSIEVFVERIDRAGFPELAVVADAVRSGAPVAVLTCVQGPPERVGRRIVLERDARHGTFGDARLDGAALADGRRLLATGQSGALRYPDDAVTVLVRCHVPPPRLIVFGAVEVAAALAGMAALLGYRVTVCDARPVFTTTRRFPRADEVVVQWPHRYLAAEAEAGRLDERTAVCVLSHDPKFDVPVLRLALELGLGFVGALGSRRTHDDRLDRLRAAGVPERALSRLASPIGLDLGGRTAAETAVSIAAELVAARHGRPGGRLSTRTGRIHG